jgi:hypothetical protein
LRDLSHASPTGLVVLEILGTADYQEPQHRGVKMFSCHTPLEEQVRVLIAQNKLTQ